jgi:predicted nucleic acid-binding protein
VLAYAEGVNGEARREETLHLLGRLPEGAVAVPVQALGELFNVLTRKAGRTRSKARAALLSWQDAYPTIETSMRVVTEAAELASARRLGIWDSIMIAAAADAGCRILLSEDLQDGFGWRGVTVADPYAATPHPLLTALLAGASRTAGGSRAPEP